MIEETMPILGDRVPGLTCVPMRLLGEDVAQRNHGQTLKRLKERGGLAVGEILSIMHGDKWGTYKNDKASAQKVLDIINADSVAVYKERLKEKVNEEAEDLESSDSWQNGYKAALTKVLKLIDD